MLGERVDAGALPQSLLAFLHNLGLLVGGGRPAQLTAFISQHQPGAVHPQQRLGRAGDLLQRPREILFGVQGGQGGGFGPGWQDRWACRSPSPGPGGATTTPGPSTAVGTAGSVRHGRILNPAAYVMVAHGVVLGEEGYPIVAAPGG
jgi:hypothetical protein